MLIDWFTVAAQIVNFLVLVALLKYFLYGRIIKAMDERERKIASRLEEAERKREEAEGEAESLRRKSQELEQTRKEFLSQAREEAEKVRKESIREAREEIDQLRSRWREAVRQEKDSFFQELRQGVTREVGHIARRALKDLANADLEQQIVNSFIGRLEHLDQEKQRSIAALIGKADETITVLSAFEISSSDRQRITKAVRSYIRDGIEVEYQRSPDMILGIEIRSRGYKMAWSLDDYLESLEASIGQVLEDEARETSKKDQGEARGE